MVTEQERQLCLEILETGEQKWRRELGKLAELAGVVLCDDDSEISIHQKLGPRLGEICAWLDGNYNAHAEQFDKLRVQVNMGNDYGQYRKLHVDDGDDHYYWGYERLNCRNVVNIPRKPVMSTCLADWAMEAVKTSLKNLKRLQSICIHYRTLKGEVDELETWESLDRVAKFRHQLELLKDM